MTVQHKKCCYGDILVRVGTSNTVRPRPNERVRVVQLIDTRWFALTLMKIDKLFSFQ